MATWTAQMAEETHDSQPDERPVILMLGIGGATVQALERLKTPVDEEKNTQQFSEALCETSFLIKTRLVL